MHRVVMWSCVTEQVSYIVIRWYTDARWGVERVTLAIEARATLC